MELRSIATIETQNRVTSVPSFTLQTSRSGKYLLDLRQNHFEVCFVDYQLTATPLKQFDLSRCIIDYPDDCPAHLLTKERTSVLKSLDQHNYVDVLLAAKWDEGSIHQGQRPTTVPLKIEFSPLANGKELIAVLMSSGSFTLFKKTDRKWTTCCDIGAAHLKEINVKTAKSYADLEDSLGFAEILSFDWLETADDLFQLLWITKNGSLYSGTFNPDTEEHKIVNLSPPLKDVYQIKTIGKNGKATLALTISTLGNISLYKISKEKATTKLSKLTNLWTESDHITVNHVSHCQLPENGLRLFVVKGFFLLIFDLNEGFKLKSTIVEQLPGPFITGLQLIDESRFIVTLVNRKFLHGTLVKERIDFAEVQNSFDQNYSCTGIVCARNKAMWILSFTAGKPFDYTVLKTPERMIFATLSQMSPFQITVDDPQRRISSHFEYFAMLRFRNISTSVEEMRLQELIAKEKNSNLEVIAYLLKIQMFLLSTKKLGGKELKKMDLLRNIVMALRFYESMNKLLRNRSSLTDQQRRVLYNCHTFVSNVLQSVDQFYQSLLLRLKDRMKSAMDKSQILNKDAPSEQCLLCDEQIIPGGLTCVQLHEVNRCCYTNLQIPLMTSTSCRVCGLQSLNADEVNEILGTTISQPVCATCDTAIE